MLRSPFAERHEDPDGIRRQDPFWNERRPMPSATEARLEFGSFSVSLRKRELLADGVPVKLGTRAFDVLLVLLEANGSLVVKGELLKRAWHGIIVSEDNLKLQISELRRALGGDHELIRTEFGRGYRLTAAVRRTGPELPEALPRLAATGTRAGGETDDAADLASIAARLAAIEAKLAEALAIRERAPAHTTIRFRRRRSCADRAGRSSRAGQPLAGPADPGPRQSVLRPLSPT
jgi:DNA-binding winged helix-turn-helix (wHTH) protein